jgi:hypothetical protein
VRSFLPLLSMVIVAAATAYAAWPFLWGDPLRRLQESLTFLAGNPNKDYVLFLGHATKGRLLPWFYLPSLMVLQFTESVWLLVLAGMVAPFLRRKVPHRSWLIVILALWLLLPTAPLILRHAWFYDNFRQFLFITPAVFILAAFGLDVVRDGLGRVGRPRLWPVLIALLLLPGVIAIVRLHPYEYTYFNSLVGGTRGAFRRFELDYWATSYSAAIKRLNATLPAGSVVAFLGTSSPAAPYARPDLVLRTYTFDADPSTVRADVLVATTRANADMDLQRFSCRVDDITVVGAILATVRDPAPCGQP